jgi:tetratricopeptide (TPR) repeat protein
MRQLAGRKLIEIFHEDDGSERYRIHRLLQKKIVVDAGAMLKFDSAMTKATRLVWKKFPRSPPEQVPAPKNRLQCQKQLPHTLSLLRAYKDAFEFWGDSIEQTFDLAQLFYDAGFSYWDRSATASEGLDFLDTAEKILDRMEEDNKEVLKLRADIHCMSGLLRITMGCQSRAELKSDLEQALKIRNQLFDATPDDHLTDVLLRNAATDYGIMLMNNYEFEEAEARFTECLQRYRKWGDETKIPFEYSKYYYNTGIIRMIQGHLKEAVEFLQKSCDLLEIEFGQDNQWLENRFALGCVMLHAGRPEEALQIQMDTLAMKKKLLGKHNKSTILSMYAVGTMNEHMGDFKTAM